MIRHVYIFEFKKHAFAKNTPDTTRKGGGGEKVKEIFYTTVEKNPHNYLPTTFFWV